MAATAMRALGNVKSSAMMPRQPEVPNFMGETAILFMPAVLYLGGENTLQQSAHTEAKSYEA